MKLVAMVLFLPVAALAVMVEPLPPIEYADTEASTNIVFVVERSCGAACELVKAEGKLPGFKLEVR